MEELKKLKNVFEGIEVYNAGIPKFPRNFTRDGIISAILINDAKMLKNQLRFCSLNQGSKKNPITGEEPGKIFHEYPGVIFEKRENLSTEFNACDTTALFIIGHKKYFELTNDKTLLKEQKDNIQKAAAYIEKHLQNGLFTENPKFADAKKFALKVTYWKDSVLINRKGGEPKYPVVFTLAHIQNMRAMKYASELLKSKRLEENYTKMKKALENLWDYKKRSFYIAIDKTGPIQGISSDILHALYYLEKNEITKEKINEILRNAMILETKIGYSTLDPNLGDKIKNGYHSRTVWPFEQAIIYEGAKKFGLKKIMKISSRILEYLDTNPEIFKLENGSFQKGGCDPQLWTIAAKKYFKRQKINSQDI